MADVRTLITLLKSELKCPGKVNYEILKRRLKAVNKDKKISAADKDLVWDLWSEIHKIGR